jgi:hypothetical protein
MGFTEEEEEYMLVRYAVYPRCVACGQKCHDKERSIYHWWIENQPIIHGYCAGLDFCVTCKDRVAFYTCPPTE